MTKQAFHRDPQSGTRIARTSCLKDGLPQGGFTPPEDLNEMGPQTSFVCLGVDDLKPIDAMEFAQALI